MDWFLYDRDFRHERVKRDNQISEIESMFSTLVVCPKAFYEIFIFLFFS